MQRIDQFKKNLIDLGFEIRIQHLRLYQHAYYGLGKIKTRTIMASEWLVKQKRNAVSDTLFELLPMGGETHVTITYKKTGEQYKATARCRATDPYNKQKGVQICCDRIVAATLNELSAWIKKYEALLTIPTPAQLANKAKNNKSNPYYKLLHNGY